MRRMPGTPEWRASRIATARDVPPRLSEGIEDGSGVQQCGDVENIIIESGRRPHGLLHSLDEVRCRASDTRGALLEWMNQAALASI